MATVEADIREIRQSVYGRDMREPIADACVHLRKRITQEQIDQTTAWMESLTERLEDVPKHVILRVEAVPKETWYTYEYENVNFEIVPKSDDQIAEAVKNNIYTETLPDGGSCLVNNVDGSSVSAISSDNYEMFIPNPITETHVHHGEEYTLTFVIKGGS